MTTGFGFADRPYQAHSLPLSINFEGYQITIGSNLSDLEIKNGIIFPRLVLDDGAIRLSFLNLGIPKAPRLPQSVFYRLMSKTPLQKSDELFGRIQHGNRMQFITLLRKINNHKGEIISLLRESALNQLEALSACFGTRTLDDEVVESNALRDI
jgi:hypothetical protein